MLGTVDGIVSEQSTNFVGKDGFFWWIGEVEDHEDPLELGRVRVRVMNFYTSPEGGSNDKLPTDKLPWATVIQHTSQAGNDGQGESAGQLQPGAIVMGFFMDGENAQMPVVMGVLRMDKGENPSQTENKQLLTGEEIPKGLGANASNLAPGQVNTGSGQKSQGTANNAPKIPGGASGPNTGSGSPSNVGNAPGVSGSSTNSQKPTTPSKPIPTASGTGGPWKMLEYQLTYLLEDLASTAGNLVAGSDGNFIDVIENKVVTLEKLTGKIQNFLSAVFTQIISALRVQLDQLIQQIESASFITSFLGIPAGTFAIIQSAISALLGLLCVQDQQLLGLIANPMGAVTSLINGVVSGLISQAEAVVQGAQEVIDQIMCSVQSVLGSIGNIINMVKSAAQGVGQITEIINAWQDGSKIFADGFDISKVSFENLIGILLMFLELFDFGCNRESNGGKDNVGFFPFFGTTACTPSALSAIPTGSAYGNCGGGSGGGFLDSFFEEADPYLTTAKNFVNGAYEMQMGTPGRQATIKKSASGTTTTSIKQNNAALAEHKARKEIRQQNPNISESEVESQVQSYVQSQTSGSSDQGNMVADHTSYAGNHTQEVHGDDCKVCDGDYVRTINGDYRIKVTGDCHLEVGGGFFLNAQGAPKQADNEGRAKSDNDKIQKHSIAFGSDLDFFVNGAEMKVHATSMDVAARDLKLSGSSYKNVYKTQTQSPGDYVITAGNSIVMDCKSMTQNINFPPLAPASTGYLVNVGGAPITFLQTPGAVPTPPYTVTTPGPYLVTCAAAGASFTVGAGAFNVTVAAGAIALTATAGAFSALCAAGAMTLTAGPTMKLTAGSIFLN